MCACINGWGRVFRYPHPHDQISNNINSYPNVMITEQQLNTTVTYDPVQTSYLPQPILRNGTAMAQPTLNPTKITLAEALSGDQNQAARIMKPNPTDICVVCMGPQVNVLVLPCNHQLHYGCLANWFNRQTTCPKCHGNVSSVKVQCNSCANYNDSVSFCPPGCPNPNHK